MILESGKDAIGMTLARSLMPYAVIGVGSSAVSASDTQLDFEVLRVPTRAANYDAATKTITYTATIPAELELSLSEIGLVSLISGNTSSGIITTFDETVEQWTGGSWVTNGVRIGSTGLNVSAATVKTLDQRPMSVELTNGDTLQVAYYGAGGSVEVRLNNTDADYLSFSFTPTAGHNVASTPISAMTRTGDVNLASINGITVVHSGSGSVTMDGIKVSAPVGDDVLIVRQKLAANYSKIAGMPLDIEIPVVL